MRLGLVEKVRAWTTRPLVLLALNIMKVIKWKPTRHMNETRCTLIFGQRIAVMSLCINPGACLSLLLRSRECVPLQCAILKGNATKPAIAPAVLQCEQLAARTALPNKGPEDLRLRQPDSDWRKLPGEYRETSILAHLADSLLRILFN